VALARGASGCRLASWRPCSHVARSSCAVNGTAEEETCAGHGSKKRTWHHGAELGRGQHPADSNNSGHVTLKTVPDTSEGRGPGFVQHCRTQVSWVQGLPAVLLVALPVAVHPHIVLFVPLQLAREVPQLLPDAAGVPGQPVPGASRQQRRRIQRCVRFDVSGSRPLSCNNRAGLPDGIQCRTHEQASYAKHSAPESCRDLPAGWRAPEHRRHTWEHARSSPSTAGEHSLADVAAQEEQLVALQRRRPQQGGEAQPPRRRDGGHHQVL
jgi:hypothetical protein